MALLHSHFEPTAWQYRWLAEYLGIPPVISFYGFDYERLPAREPKWNHRYETLLHSADAFICEGGFRTQIIRNKGCPPAKIHIVHLGVKVQNIPFHTRKERERTLHLLQIATLTPKKGHIFTIEAFKDSLAECPNITLTIVGSDREGIKKDLLECILQQENSEKNTFIDAIDFDQLYSFLNDFQVFIHPSCCTKDHDSEGGAPVVLIDAKATGMPVISTMHCDIPEEVLNGKTGILVRESDVAAFSEAIKFLR